MGSFRREIEMSPFEFSDFAETTAGENEQPNAGKPPIEIYFTPKKSDC